MVIDFILSKLYLEYTNIIYFWEKVMLPKDLSCFLENGMLVAYFLKKVIFEVEFAYFLEKVMLPKDFVYFLENVMLAVDIVYCLEKVIFAG